MNIADTVLLVLLLLGGFRGYQKGLLREIVGIVALVLGILAGIVFIEQGATFLSQVFNTYSPILSAFSFLLIFACVVMLATLLGRALKSAINLTPIGYLDGAGGALLGIIKWAFVISLLLWVLDMAEVQVNAVEESQWYPKIKYFAPLVMEQLKIWFPFLEQLIDQVKAFLESFKS